MVHVPWYTMVHGAPWCFGTGNCKMVHAPWYTMVHVLWCMYHGAFTGSKVLWYAVYHGILWYMYHGKPWLTTVNDGTCTMVNHGKPWYIYHGKPWGFYQFQSTMVHLPWFTMGYILSRALLGQLRSQDTKAGGGIDFYSRVLHVLRVSRLCAKGTEHAEFTNKICKQAVLNFKINNF